MEVYPTLSSSKRFKYRLSFNVLMTLDKIVTKDTYDAKAVSKKFKITFYKTGNEITIAAGVITAAFYLVGDYQAATNAGIVTGVCAAAGFYHDKYILRDKKTK